MSLQSADLDPNVDHRRIWDLGYELIELSRSDSYSDTWQIRHRTTYEMCAWQQLRREGESSPRGRTAIENEVAVGQLASSPLFLKLKWAHVHEKPRFAVWEWFDGITVDRLTQEYVRLPINAALWIVRQSAQGLHDLLQAGLSHGNVNMQNVLVNPASGMIKLTGLGNSRRVAQGNSFDPVPARVSTGNSTTSELEAIPAPSRMRGEARDIYGLGSVLYQSLTGRVPYEAETPAELLRGRQINLVDEVLRIRPDVSPRLAGLIRDLLLPDATRPIRHPAVLVNLLHEFELAELTRS